MGRGRRNYEQVTTNPEESTLSVSESTTVVGDNTNQRRRNTSSNNNDNNNIHSAEVALLQEPQGVPVSDAESVSVVGGDEDEGDVITVVILDVAQKKFPVKLSSNNTVQRLKAKGQAVHKVPPDRQRLIFQGRMLSDEKTLAEEKIADQTIVHLFPKPRVLIQDAAGKSVSRENSTAGETTDTAQEGDEEQGGARVPTIIMNADEAQQRSQILVLGSSDYLEASNNVKLFSFMLLIISSIGKIIWVLMPKSKYFRRIYRISHSAIILSFPAKQN